MVNLLGRQELTNERPNTGMGTTETSEGRYSIRTLDSKKTAKRITEFFLSEVSFDDRNFTKGEILQINSLPYESLKDPNFKFWYLENEAAEIIGVISLRENEQKTGGYFIDYLTVHKDYRNRGIAAQLLDVATEYSQSINGRYIYANTCDTNLYEGVRRLFARKSFHVAGHLPDYYFEGEGMIVYYKKNHLRV